jgi:hypothetical protein
VKGGWREETSKKARVDPLMDRRREEEEDKVAEGTEEEKMQNPEKMRMRKERMGGRYLLHGSTLDAALLHLRVVVTDHLLHTGEYGELGLPANRLLGPRRVGSSSHRVIRRDLNSRAGRGEPWSVSSRSNRGPKRERE